MATNAGSRLLSTMLNGTLTAYTPSWTGAGSNPAIGNGTLTGQWSPAAGIVYFTVYIAGGSTTTAGSGLYSVSLPVAAKTVSGGGPVGSYSGILDHSGVASGNTAGSILSGQSSVGSSFSPAQGYIPVSVGTSGVVQWSASSPFAISGANFTFQMSGWYFSS